MALVERQSTPICSVQVHGSNEGRGSRSGDVAPSPEGPGALKSWVARARSNVWTPIALRVCGVVLGMLALAGIGAVATARGLPGHAVPSARAGASAPVAMERASLATGGRERAAPPPAEVAQAPEPRPSPAITEDGKVILNLATVDDLRKLPGVGKKRAESIVQLREKLGGRFRRVTDLLRIRGIGPRRLKIWAPLLVLDPPPAPASPSASPSAAPSASARAPSDGAPHAGTSSR